MKAYSLGLMLCLVSSLSYANPYTTTKQQVRKELLSCVNSPDSAFSAAFNQCVIESATAFQQAADRAIQKRIAKGETGLANDRQIYHATIRDCSKQEKLSFAGYTYAAQCQLKRSQDYYRYSMSSEMPKQDNWTETNRIDQLYLSY